MDRACSAHMGAKHYRELEVWRLCEEIRRRVIAETARSPAASDRKFCNQIRDAAEDAVADVAEADRAARALRQYL